MKSKPMDKAVDISTVIYGSFIRMQRLMPLVVNSFSGTSLASATEVNLFIDLYSVLKPIFSSNFNVIINDYTAVTSTIINMCSHYRYFFKQLSVKTNIYLVYSLNCCDINRKFVAGYNDEFYNKTSIPQYKNVILDNVELMELLCKYLPDIYFIHSPRSYESSIVIGNLIETLNDGLPNIILSKDLYTIQLGAMYPNTAILVPKKYFGDDTSYMIPINEKYDYREEFWKAVARARNIKFESLMNISPVNFSLLSAISRFPERYIPMLKNVSVGIKIIESLVGNSDVKIIPEMLYDNNIISELIPVSLVESRVKAIDPMFIMSYYKQDPESKSICLDNLRDDAAINMINAKFFEKNPIDLNKL